MGREAAASEPEAALGAQRACSVCPGGCGERLFWAHAHHPPSLSPRCSHSRHGRRRRGPRKHPTRLTSWRAGAHAPAPLPAGPGRRAAPVTSVCRGSWPSVPPPHMTMPETQRSFLPAPCHLPLQPPFRSRLVSLQNLHPLPTPRDPHLHAAMIGKRALFACCLPPQCSPCFRSEVTACSPPFNLPALASLPLELAPLISPCCGCTACDRHFDFPQLWAGEMLFEFKQAGVGMFGRAGHVPGKVGGHEDSANLW